MFEVFTEKHFRKTLPDAGEAEEWLDTQQKSASAKRSRNSFLAGLLMGTNKHAASSAPDKLMSTRPLLPTACPSFSLHMGLSLLSRH